MRFVTGGACQGQIGWVMADWKIKREEIREGETLKDDEILSAKAISDFHLLIKRWISEEKTMEEMLSMLLKNPQLIIINQDIGAGIVPMDPEERKLREIHGRLCCELAKNSEQVIRVICGIGQRIK